MATSNEIVLENLKQGNPESEWRLLNGATDSIEGFATDISVDQGGHVDFKIDTDSTNYRIDIYRLGYYGGDGARKVATIEHQSSSPTLQPTPLKDPETRMVDAGNWSVTDGWDVPDDAVSGVYVAKLVRQDGTEGENHIPFIVRDDDGESDIVFQTSDTTWQAYSRWGGASVYRDNQGGDHDTRAFAVSYNRPTPTEGLNALFGVEVAAIRWLEKNGYDVSYIAGVDTARSGDELLEHKVFLSVGHDEYWSQEQRSNVEAARDAGVNLAFWGGNDVFWKTRWDTSIDSSETAYRTIVTYKESSPWLEKGKPDPSPIWTGAWRDPSQPGGEQPENSLTGSIFMVDAQLQSDAITIPYGMSQLRFWRNTDIANTQPGEVGTLAAILGYEWNVDDDNGFRPDGLIRLSQTTDEVNALLGCVTCGAPGFCPGCPISNTAAGYNSVDSTDGVGTHSLTLYRAPSGALVFSAGTVFWSWGLDDHHLPHLDNPIPPPDRNVQQAMVNLLADMGVQPESLQSDLFKATMSNDFTAPLSHLSSAKVDVLLDSYARVHGTAQDLGGGLIAAVEVSVDGGATWHTAVGTDRWSYAWNHQDDDYTVLVRAIDDSVNLEQPTAAVTLAAAAPPTRTDFSWVDGWTKVDYSRSLFDLNGDGHLDYVGFGASKTYVAYGGEYLDSSGLLDEGFSAGSSIIKNFGTSQGYNRTFDRGAADTGYGVGATIYAQADRGLYWRGATSATEATDDAGNTYDKLVYESGSHIYEAFGRNQGWQTKHGFDIVFASSTDQYASVLGFGNKGIVVGPEAFAPGADADDAYTIRLGVGNQNGWDQRIDVRTFTDSDGDAIDLNQDGYVDFVGMGPKGLVYAYGADDVDGRYTLGDLQTAHIDGANSEFGRDQGWTNERHTRLVVKDPETGYYDIIAFGVKGVYVSMGQDPTTHGGEAFGDSYKAMSDMGTSEGWSPTKTPRLVGDVNSDGVPDIVGFGATATYIALGTRDEEGRLFFHTDPSLTIQHLGYTEGWDATTLRALVDNLDGDGQSGLVLSGADGTQIWDLEV